MAPPDRRNRPEERRVSKTLLPEIVVPGRRLGRHVQHDPRSLAYRVGRTAEPTTVRWERRIPILDQGDLGACTGYATVGVLGTEPFYSLLSWGGVIPALGLTGDYAKSVYSAATKIDPFDGAWEPDDTGSDGLSVAKVITGYGLISGYRHITSIGEAHAAIQDGPFIVGTLWMSGMDQPNYAGIVKPSGTARGGHEYECLGYHASIDQWEFVNSWSEDFGLAGHFFMDTPSFEWLLGQQGDATPFVPITAPAPQPTPQPDAAQFPWADVDPWLSSPHWWKRATVAAKAVKAWKAGL
jgi:hypothetical protein